MTTLSENAADRFWSKVDTGDRENCWAWIGSLDRHGYGQFKPKSRASPMRSHRVAWILAVGEIPEKLYVCHHCDNRRCCNPSHLFLSSHYGNYLDAERKGRILRGDTYRATVARKAQNA